MACVSGDCVVCVQHCLLRGILQLILLFGLASESRRCNEVLLHLLLAVLVGGSFYWLGLVLSILSCFPPLEVPGHCHFSL